MYKGFKALFLAGVFFAFASSLDISTANAAATGTSGGDCIDGQVCSCEEMRYDPKFNLCLYNVVCSDTVTGMTTTKRKMYRPKFPNGCVCNNVYVTIEEREAAIDACTIPGAPVGGTGIIDFITGDELIFGEITLH